MVKAILDGRKTCTRRVVKGYIPKDAEFGYTTFTPNGAISCRGIFETGYPGYGEKFFEPQYNRGDILYVRETWHKYAKRVGNGESCHLAEFYGYKASIANSEDANEPWKPSIHMPKEAARIWLKVTGVRVEQLQEITEAEAILEGAIDNRAFIHSPDNEYDHIHTAREHFIDIWNSTIKKSDLDKYGWSANPWVWVIEFERCEEPGKGKGAMMNRYLFKAKRRDDGQWIKGTVLFHDVDAATIFNQHPADGSLQGFEVDPSTICQCTGLKDKNGNLIWENDILMCHGNREDIVKAVYGKFTVINAETLESVDNVVGWHYEVIPTDSLSKCEPFCLPMPLTDEYVKICEFEVIGNVFENPELLESEG